MKKRKKPCRKKVITNFILLTFMLAGSCLMLCGCSDSRSGDVPPSGASKILYMRRAIPSGKFEPYVLDDKEALEQLRSAIREDVLHASIMPSNENVSASSMHELLFYDAENTLMFRYRILGDSYLVMNSNRYGAKNTMNCLKDLFKTKFRPVDPEEAMKDYREIGKYANVMETGASDETDDQQTKSESPEPVVSDSKP